MTGERQKPPLQHKEQSQTIDLDNLTPRETEVLACLVHKHSSNEIAILLSITTRTVQAHVYHIMEKFGYRSRRKLAESVEHSALLPILAQRYGDLCQQKHTT